MIKVMTKTPLRLDHEVSARIAGSSRRYVLGMRLVSTLARPGVTLSVSFLLLFYGYFAELRTVLIVGSVSLMALCVGSALKLLIHRTRPVTKYARGRHPFSYSFPSGHSVGSIVLYGSCAHLLASGLGGLATLGVYAAVGIIVFLIGVSRVYLGAHYISDVLAGWLLGGAGLLACVLLSGS